RGSICCAEDGHGDEDNEVKTALSTSLRLVLACCAGYLSGGCSREAPPPDVVLTSLDPSLAHAIQTSRQTVLTRSHSADAWGNLGETLHAAEFHAEARACYTRAARLDSRSARWPHLLGLLQLQDLPDAALANLNRAAELAGTETDAPRLRLAQALVERGRFRDAAKHLNALLSGNPGHAAARLELARMRLDENQLASAAELLEPCLTNAYTGRGAHWLLGQVRAREGDTEAATILARQAAAMARPFDWPDPFLREVQSLRADRSKLSEQANLLLIQRRFPEAETILTGILKELPDDAEALLLLGRLRIQQRRCAEAEPLFQRHLAVQTNSLNGMVQLGLAMFCQQRWNDAAAAFERAVALKPDFAQAHYNLGLTRARSHDSSGAIRSFREALRCSPGDAATHAALAEEFILIGGFGEALAHADRALALETNHPKAKAARQRALRSR
ncbi:MAG: tetratricopeptide repeat protein, partial [Verrucomicrobiota bacterium]